MMSELTNYNPLKKIWLPGAEIDDPQGIIIVVGPNSSGKTLFLRDIENYLLSGTPSFVVCKGVAAQKPSDFQAFVDDLIAKNLLQVTPAQAMFGGQGVEHYRTNVPLMRVAEPNFPARPNGFFQPNIPNQLNPQFTQQNQNMRTPFSLDALRKAYDEFITDRDENNSSWFGPIGSTLAALLSLDQRRLVCNKAPSFDYKQNPPDLPLQGLHINGEAQRRLVVETGNVFGNAVWLDISEQGVYQLRVSGNRIRPPVEETNSPLAASKFSAIENEGDGYRSYVGICVSLLLATRPVSLIDEPELCLHPPQAYHIGKFIGRYAKEDHVTVIATHSSHVLRGILETGKRVTVVRLTRHNKEFTARCINEEELVDNLRNPRTRAEAVLDGVFSKGVVLVESEGDREEYQAASEAIEDSASREVHFVPVGGTGGFADPLRFYRSLEIPAAIIADLDAVCDTDKMIVLIEQILTDPTKSDELVSNLRNVANQIKSLPPPITETDAKKSLKELSEQTWDWQQGEDNVLRRKLNEIVGNLRRIRRLKEGGTAAYEDNPNIQTALVEIIRQFSLIGLFLVPLGELEGWATSLMTDVPKGNMSKTDRAAVAANRIREAEHKSGDIWEFVRKVFGYLNIPNE
jgi:ABC-type cobalamin/Fe3+-siderophores transport system ATPase subunit